MPSEESLSLEETNKVRISLGLAPLAGENDNDDAGSAAGDGSDVEPDKDAIAEANYAQRRREEAQARSDKETKERLSKARNQRDLRAKLAGKGLGEADATEDSGGAAAAADWVKQSRKRAKQRAAELEKLRLREKELDDRDREATYGEEDLAGLKVAHGIKDFEEGKDVVLTLADRKVLDDEDDELQNINLAEYARTAERLDLKKKGKTAYKYTGYDEQEEQFDPENIGKGKSVLAKYDEEIGGIGSSSKDGGFRLGGNMPASSSASAGKASTSGGVAQETEQRELNRDLLSLDYSKLEQTDYLQEGDVGFKKPKKKKTKSSKASRRAVALDDTDDLPSLPTNGDTEMAQEEDDTPKVPTAERRLAKEGGNGGDGAVIDDEDLQAALARQRRAAGKKRIQAMKEEDAARRTMQESSISANGTPAADEEMPAVKTEDGEPLQLNGGNGVKTEEEEDDGLLIMNDTSEFIRNISARPLISKKDQPNNRKNKANGGFVKVKSEPRDDDEQDVPLDEVDMSTKVEEEEDEEPEEGEALSEEDNGMAVDGEEEDVKPDIRNASSSKGNNEDDKNPSAGFGSTADEKLISGGMASTLSLLRQSGLIKPLTPEEIERDRAYKEKERFIAEARLRDAQRDMERARLKASGSSGSGEHSGKKGGNSAAAQAEQTQREYENKRLQFQHAQKTLEAFKDYKPNVEITYHDEFGRNLTPKEAWKDLSHKFHGKGSGTNKREKLLKKIEEERKREAMASGDSPLNTNTAFQARQERLGTATMVLGVGNKNAAPSADILLGSSSSGKAGVNIAKRGNPAAGPSGSNKRKKDGPKVLG